MVKYGSVGKLLAYKRNKTLRDMSLTANPVLWLTPNIIEYVNSQFLRCGQMCCMLSFLII